MHGDYEAQRHWMEITTALPLHLWYVNGTDNDLMYWGLDYPPLTAYFSWIWGKVAQAFVPSLVELHKSRGIETAETKLFMRSSVIISELITYIPAALFFTFLYYNGRRTTLLHIFLLLFFAY
ncbi:dolichyl pyrophosphate Man9GlcNAc2 alpha-1,3-glucosyltransferase [Pelomyxa schiedti]|nr:dolichyl pyrophosphate Man9GlcNAc2 alpha-1,3-glucosyltransferase [Pelomyxa schiedti]